MTRSVIRQQIRRALTRLHFCYASHLRRPEDSQGRWEIRFTIGATGEVLRAGVVSFRAVDAGGHGETNPGFERCIRDVFCSLQFPPRPGAEEVHVTYPLHIDWAYY